MTLRERFGANLREARLAGGLSQEDLGFRCALHRTEISLLERGGREPQLETVVRLAGGLGVGPEQLCAGIAWLPGAERLRVSRKRLAPPRVKRSRGRRPSR